MIPGGAGKRRGCETGAPRGAGRGRRGGEEGGAGQRSVPGRVTTPPPPPPSPPAAARVPARFRTAAAEPAGAAAARAPAYTGPERQRPAPPRPSAGGGAGSPERLPGTGRESRSSSGQGLSVALPPGASFPKLSAETGSEAVGALVSVRPWLHKHPQNFAPGTRGHLCGASRSSCGVRSHRAPGSSPVKVLRRAVLLLRTPADRVGMSGFQFPGPSCLAPQRSVNYLLILRIPHGNKEFKYCKQLCYPASGTSPLLISIYTITLPWQFLLAPKIVFSPRGGPNESCVAHHCAYYDGTEVAKDDKSSGNTLGNYVG
ncbi:uncharacterized protein LJ264_002090 [Porphyrio hochstetteri]